MRRAFASLAVSVVVFSFALPIFAYAQAANVDAVADQMCAVWVPGCGPCSKQKPGANGCEPMPSNMYMCPCAGPHASGICQAPSQCKATATMDGKLDPGMAKLGEMLAKLMEALKPKDGGGGGGGGSPTPGQTCTTLQPSGDKATVESNPACYYYQQPTDLGGTGVDPSGGLVATPTSGATPLEVTFAFTNGNSGCNTPTLVIDFGDGKTEQQQIHTGTTCNGTAETTKHTYTQAGEFAARLLNATTQEIRGGVNLSITAGEGTTETPTPDSTTSTGGTNTNVGTTGFTSGNSTNIGNTLFTTPLSNLGNTGSVSTGGTSGNTNSTTAGSASTGGTNGGGTGASLNFNTPQSIVQSIIQKNLPPGAYGDVKILSNGTTIIAGMRENNTEVAGFYGSNSTSGTSAVAKMCANRPWASNFLSYVIPPSFFDSLCSWRGYTVGGGVKTTTTTTTGTLPTLKSVTGGTTKTITTATKPATTTAPVTAIVDIWASPSTVPLGARTSVFWNTQGVTDCIETSPDGSFAHATLKGGASTVPLTSATTYTISCVAPNGAHVTDNVIVQIAL